VWPIIFCLFVVFLFVLPLLPGLVELRFATDTKPLSVIQEYNTDITYFAKGFKTYLEKNFISFFSAEQKLNVPIQQGILRDNTNFQIIRNRTIPVFNLQEISRAKTDWLIIADSALILPGQIFFQKEIYSRNSISAGENSQFRALLAEENITLGKGCSILRWVHSGGSLFVDPNCNLYGRASAGSSITLSKRCVFERLHAPKIMFGKSQPVAAGRKKIHELLKVTTIPNVKDQYTRRWLIDGDIEIPENSFFDGDLIASRNVVIGAGSHIRGSIKSNNDLQLQNNVQVDGSVVSTGNLYIGNNCNLSGPVIAEDTIFIETGSTVGTETAQTTVSGLKIHIASGVVVFGSVWAEESARVAS